MRASSLYLVGKGMQQRSAMPCRFRRACMRLLQRADALMPLMEGLEVRIAEASMVAPDGAHIDIAWDFDI